MNSALPLVLPVVVRGGPNWAEWITVGATVALALGVIAAIIGALLAKASIDESIKTRHAQIAIDMSRRYDEADLLKVKHKVRYWTPDELKDRYRALAEADSDELWELDRLANFFEDLGTLCKMKALEIAWIDEMMGGACMAYWHKWSALTNELRAEQNEDRNGRAKLYENWEAIADEINSRRS